MRYGGERMSKNLRSTIGDIMEKNTPLLLKGAHALENTVIYTGIISIVDQFVARAFVGHTLHEYIGPSHALMWIECAAIAYGINWASWQHGNTHKLRRY